ncbi:putative nuclease HARBI1 [Drosophila bipectinata]|uniref:putative nuclease HARBI1 n=1 Tax=Drosophila bipectinata TaxID=42026 RepID=UPI0038B36D56
MYLAAKELRKQKKTGRRAKTNNYLLMRNVNGRFERDFDNMVKTPTVFFENFHMSVSNFEDLFLRNFRLDAIPLEAKLALTLEYLACGTFQRHVASCYHISKQHVGVTIPEVCDAICVALSGEIEAWDVEAMKRRAQEFQGLWQFPNCIGAIDGKHVAIKAPPHCGSAFYNYKGFHSIILLAICDASCRFTFIDVGAYKSEGDMKAFSKSWIGRELLEGGMEFPEDNMLGGVRTPYFLVADDAFLGCLMLFVSSGFPVLKTRKVFIIPRWFCRQ